MAIAAAFDLDVHQWDAINAFINGYQEETGYGNNPKGFDLPGRCLLLLRALWFADLTFTLVERILFHAPGAGFRELVGSNQSDR